MRMGLEVTMKEGKEGWKGSKEELSSMRSQIISALWASSDLLGQCLGTQHIVGCPKNGYT